MCVCGGGGAGGGADDELGCCKFQLESHSVHSLPKPKANLQVMPTTSATLATAKNCLFVFTPIQP